jgi:hypothetical protein
MSALSEHAGSRELAVDLTFRELRSRNDESVPGPMSPLLDTRHAVHLVVRSPGSRPAEAV